MGEIQRINHYEWIAVSYTLKSIFVVIAFCALLKFNFHLFIAIAGMSASFLFIQWFYDVKKIELKKKFVFEIEGVKELLYRSLPLAVTTVIDTFILFLPRHNIESILGSEMLGVYGTITIVVVVLSTLGSSVWSSLMKTFAEAFESNDSSSIWHLILTVSLVLTVFSVLFLTIGSRLAPFFYRLLFGKEIVEYMYMLISVLPNCLLLLFNSFFPCILIPLSKNNVYMYSDILSLLILIIIGRTMCINYGLIGASFSLTISLSVRFIFLVVSSFVIVKQQFEK